MHAAAWREGLDAAVQQARASVDRLVAARANQGTAQLQGFFAEQWHAHSLEIDAYKKEVTDLFVRIPQSTSRASADIAARLGDGPVLEAQVKYYRSAADTAKQLWNPDYTSMQSKVVPADQVAEVIARSAKKAATDARVHVREASMHSADHVSDRMRIGGAESRPLSRQESEDLTRKALRGEDVMGQLGTLSGEELAKRMAFGGAVAGGIGVAIAFAPAAAKAFKAWKAGEPDLANQLLKDGGVKALKAGGWAGLQGAMATGLVEAARAGALGPMLADVSPGAVGAIAVVIVQSIRDGHALYSGEISGAEFAQRCATNSAVAAGGVAGAALGQVLIPIPVLGSLIGSVVGGLVARGGIAALEWTIDKMAPVVGALLEYAGETLFGWQTLQEAQRLSLAVLDELGNARLAIDAAKDFRLDVIPTLRVGAIDIDAMRTDAAAMEAELDALEGDLGGRGK